jgi:hypothetical protein
MHCTVHPCCNNNTSPDTFPTFIEPVAILPIEVLSFDSEQFTNNSMNKVIEGKRNDSFVHLEKLFFAAVMLYTKNYEVQFEDLLHEVLDFFSEP